MQTVPQIHVFLGSPGDVNEERAIVLEVLDMLEYDPLFKHDTSGGISIHAVAWDKHGGDTPMRATMTPQTAIQQGLLRPSECDIVLMLIWGRMGTPLPYPEYQKDDGSPYISGTEWEYWDAVNAERARGKPITLIYRRTERPNINIDDDEALEQYRSVRSFFEGFRDPATGALLGGVNEYKDPEDLRQRLINHLRIIMDNILSQQDLVLSRDQLGEAPPLWKGSPFLGLRAFEEKDAPIFFGRGLETSELVKRVEVSRFVALIAASGSGKSSLVAAGLIPRLKSNALMSGATSSKDWRYVRLTPGTGDNPFSALFDALCVAFPEHTISPFMIVQEKRAFIESLKQNPQALVEICNALLKEANAPDWAEILFFIDQFEELFTVVKPDDRTLLVELLTTIFVSQRLRAVVTMRSDFYGNCLELPALAALLKDATYPVASPTAGALVEMIKRPAERAGLLWDDQLPERIQGDTGNEVGALALMAYALDELYNMSLRRGDKRLTFDDYHAIGGVQGAIGKRAAETFERLGLQDKDRLLQRVFRELVTVDERGTATRQRAVLGQFSQREWTLISAFADARLLVTDVETVEVAHEAVFHSWERLEAWIAEAQEDLILLRQVRAAADEWARTSRLDYMRWPAERLKPVYEMIERQDASDKLSELERDFIEPEQNRLLREIADIRTDHKRRCWIGERLATINDFRFGIGLSEEGVPQIDWLLVSPDGDIKIRDQVREVPSFYIARYLITYRQFQVFLDAPDGYKDDRWWYDFPHHYAKQAIAPAVAQYDNYPRDSVSWYQCVAYTRWLDAKYRQYALFGELPADEWQIRLPTEWEWQWVAQGGTETREYPWGTWDEKPRMNTTEAGISDRSTAVGMYPDGAAQCGAMDMAGNLWEWCLNDYDSIGTEEVYSNEQVKVVRGGSFHYRRGRAICAYRNIFHHPYDNHYSYGLRVVMSTPI